MVCRLSVFKMHAFGKWDCLYYGRIEKHILLLGTNNGNKCTAITYQTGGYLTLGIFNTEKRQYIHSNEPQIRLKPF